MANLLFGFSTYSVLEPLNLQNLFFHGTTGAVCQLLSPTLGAWGADFMAATREYSPDTLELEIVPKLDINTNVFLILEEYCWAS
jgi:hypothetical protein